MYVPQPLSTKTGASPFAIWLGLGALSAVSAMFAFPFMWPRHTMPIPSFYSEAVAAFVMLTAALLYVFERASGNAQQRSYRIPFVALIFVPLMLVLALQLACGRFSVPYNGLFPMMVIVAAIAATLLGAGCRMRFGDERLLTAICIALLIGGGWNVLAQFVQLTKSWQFITLFSYSTGSLYGNLAQRNHLSTYLCWALLATFYLFSKGHLRIFTAALLSAVFLIGIVLTASRTSWVQVIWIAVAGSYLILRMPKEARPRKWGLLLGLPFAMLMITLVLPYVMQAMQLHFTQTGMERLQAEGLDRNRWLIYSQVWEMIKTHPWLGVGPGELQFNQLLLMDRYDAVLFASSAHNVVLDLLVMTGLLGTIGFAWFGLGWYLRVRRIQPSLETVTMLMMLAVLGIHSLLEFPEWYAFFLFPAAFLIGALETRFIVLKNRSALRISSLVTVSWGIVGCAVLWYQYVQTETLYYTRYQKNPEAKAASADLLRELYEYRERTFFKGPADFVLSWNLQLSPQAVDEKLRISERAIRYQPSANGLYRHIVLLGLAGREEEALFYLVRLKASFPGDFMPIAEKLVEAGGRTPAQLGRIGARAGEMLRQQGEQSNAG